MFGSEDAEHHGVGEKCSQETHGSWDIVRSSEDKFALPQEFARVLCLVVVDFFLSETNQFEDIVSTQDVFV